MGAGSPFYFMYTNNSALIPTKRYKYRLAMDTLNEDEKYVIEQIRKLKESDQVLIQMDQDGKLAIKTIKA